MLILSNNAYLFARYALTVRLFLPFALLAANTLLPLGVDILSLNPCLFLFFLSDGWNVLLLISNIFLVYNYSLHFQSANLQIISGFANLFLKNKSSFSKNIFFLAPIICKA